LLRRYNDRLSVLSRFLQAWIPGFKGRTFAGRNSGFLFGGGWFTDRFRSIQAGGSAHDYDKDDSGNRSFEKTKFLQEIPLVVPGKLTSSGSSGSGAVRVRYFANPA
jgi:hypothetical protein